ncbi:MAG: rhomboid family intramembrane serine protease [Bacteroidota bacterium]
MSLMDDIKYKLNSHHAVTRIIAINVAVYLVFALAYVLFWLFQATPLIAGAEQYFFLYAKLSNFIKQPWGIVTYMFFHAGFLHLLFNMLWLYWFGMLLHEYLGNTRVYQAYFIGGLFGGLLYILAYNVFPVFNANLDGSYALGASAGVLAVVVATATLLPRHTILLFGIIPLQLRYIALVSVLIDLVNIPTDNPGGRIAHLGGALSGFLFIKYLYTNNTFTNGMHQVSESIKKIFKTKAKSNLKVHHKAAKGNVTPQAPFNKPNQADVDAILDKISKSGYESLSKKEKEILFKASED